MQLNQELILITFYGRSGSFFIHSLLDGHEELLTFPPVIQHHFFTAIDRDKPDLGQLDSCWDYFNAHFGYLCGDFSNAQLHEKSLNQLKVGNIPIPNSLFCTKFKFEFERIYNCMLTEADHTKRLFLIMHYAYHCAIKDKSFSLEELIALKVLFQLHVPGLKSISRLSSWFQNTSVIQTIRHPLVGFRSLIKHHKEDYELTPKRLVALTRQVLFGGFKIALPTVKHIGVKLEDLHCTPNETLLGLCNWLNIGWQDSLLNSTFDDQAWGNLAGREHISGFMPDSVSYDANDLFPERDKFIFENLLKTRYNSWSYTLSKPSRDTNEYSNVYQRPLLIEYLPFFDDIGKAISAYNSNLEIERNTDLLFFIDYCEHHVDEVVRNI